MSFGLKNAGTTYQRLINKMFAHQIGRNVQVYIDDMLVKSRKEDDHLDDLKETFEQMCVWGDGWKFPGVHNVSEWYRSQPR